MRKSWARWIGAAGMAAVLLGAWGGWSSETRGAEDIVAGPMLGHVGSQNARVWLELSLAKQVGISCYEDRGGEVSSVSVDVEGPLPYTADIPLTNLKPNKDYHIQLTLDGAAVKVPGPELTIRTQPAPGTEATFGVGFGGGLEGHGLGTMPVFKAAASQNPRAFFFLGDTLMLPAKLAGYPRTHKATVRFIAEAYSKARTEPDLAELLRTVPCYAVWSDGDFGVTGANKDWIFKDEAWTAFQHFWPNPDWGTPQNPGCYFTSTIGDVDFFMLDGRMYRDADSDPNKKTMLGAKQLAWLKKGLAESRANFKVIGCASQLLVNDGQGDTWAAYQPEQQDFLDWIFANHISGVVFVSGGDHAGEITQIKPANGKAGAYPLFEVTSSALSGPGDKPPANGDRQGAAVMGNQFGTLDFGGEREHRFLTMRIRDEQGKVKVEQTVFELQLQH